MQERAVEGDDIGVVTVVHDLELAQNLLPDCGLSVNVNDLQRRRHIIVRRRWFDEEESGVVAAAGVVCCSRLLVSVVKQIKKRVESNSSIWEISSIDSVVSFQGKRGAEEEGEQRQGHRTNEGRKVGRKEGRKGKGREGVDAHHRQQLQPIRTN